jgi:hypothetical protein
MITSQTNKQHKQNKLTETPVPLVGFEPKVPALQWTTIIHASDDAATRIDKSLLRWRNNLNFHLFICNVNRPEASSATSRTGKKTKTDVIHKSYSSNNNNFSQMNVK